MAKHAKKTTTSADSSENVAPLVPSPPPISTVAPKKKEPKLLAQPSTSALIICRNKHWRYISSFHGPWLQLPPEVLESLANHNYLLPRPRPIDPAVFFDLLKIRRLVEEATNLSVRAASGVTASTLSNQSNFNNGLLGNDRNVLGIGLGGGGGNAKLSPERKHRMREQATQKLSKAYHLDEIACSVATMQAASTLEDVAQLVLQRSANDADAKYVHFFHEKIPSRQMAESTSLKPLDEIIADRPSEGEPLRTRAVVKMFKEDWMGAAADLTAALQINKHVQSRHNAGKQELQLASSTASENSRNTRWKDDFRLEEEDQPSGLESQLLFHRAGVYLTIACQRIDAALSITYQTPQNGANRANEKSTPNEESTPATPTQEESEKTPAEKQANEDRLDARKFVKAHAKRALRDYIAFLSHFDYTPGLSSGVIEEFVKKVNETANGFRIPRPQPQSRVYEITNDSALNNDQSSDALIPHPQPNRSRYQNGSSSGAEIPVLPPPTVYQISTLFASTPIDLPPYPTTAIISKKAPSPSTQAAKSLAAQADLQEAITYHPLLTDALHSLLLCHTLIQTSPTELSRHANMVARLARLCDGYPIFQAARSPARADWTEVLRRASVPPPQGPNTTPFIHLNASWDTLCSSAPLPEQNSKGAGGGANGTVGKKKETDSERQERLQQKAIMEALEDERVCDEKSFKAAVKARQRRWEEDWKETASVNGNKNGNGAKKSVQDEGKDYPISTERAAAVVKWIREAEVGGEGGGKRKKKGRGKGKSREEKLEESVEALKLGGEVEEGAEEEVE